MNAKRVRFSCEVCGSPVSTRSLFCRRCGSVLQPGRVPWKFVVLLAAAPILVATLLGAVWLHPSPSSFSLAVVGFACLACGSGLILAGPFFRAPENPGDLRRKRLLHALEAARRVPLPVYRRIRPMRGVEASPWDWYS